MRKIELVAAVKTFGDVRALDSVDLSIEPGSHLAILGPSGSGKSTLLRVVAGLEAPTSGDVRFDSASQLGIAPHKRDVALVFQQYSLYPHLTALGNITIGLRHGRRLPAAEADTRAKDVARTLGIEELLGRRPKAMSGGQRQRVALARAMARRSGIVLLDEPLSGLDAQLRLTLRVEITGHLHRTGATVIHVTHDQSDAMTAADTVAVMNGGRIVQIGPPAELYDQPATLFVARFVGTPPMNVFSATHQPDGQLRSNFGHHPTRSFGAELTDVRFGVRPELVRIDSNGPWSTDAVVAAVEHAGPERIIHLSVPSERGTPQPVAVRTSAALPAVGDHVPLSVEPEHVHVFAGPDSARIGDAAMHLTAQRTSTAV